jgi:seryl-tRNA synthetase
MSQQPQLTETTFLDQLLQHGLLIASPTMGIYGRSGVLEDVISRLADAITARGRESNAEIMRFPPVISRETTEQSGYMESFPQLLGSVHAFTGKKREHSALLHDIENHQDWGQHMSSTQVVLTPAACYPIYAAMAGETLPAGGRLVDVSSYCFRHEPSADPARMQAFRQHELVCVADPDTVQQRREEWTAWGLEYLRALGLQPVHAPAHDPFFGAGGRFLAASQEEQLLKFELLAPVSSEQPTTAVVSINYHQDHFAHNFTIRTADGQIAHTACIGFGLERIALALFRAHGFAVAEWPAEVRRKLWEQAC